MQEEVATEMRYPGVDGLSGTLDSGASILDVIPQGVAAMLAAARDLTEAVRCQMCTAAPDSTRREAAHAWSLHCDICESRCCARGKQG